MPSESDGLVDHLLFHIALSSNQGLPPSDFARCVVDFHRDDIADDATTPPVVLSQRDLFFSAAPPKQKLVVDSNYLESLWVWIRKDNDVREESTEATALGSSCPADQRVFLAQHASQRLFATENRIWHTVANHGVDWKKLPKLEFQCLCVIAAHGVDGMLQPDLVRLTGQDKRSVPKRTDALATKGYITKESCLGSGVKTSFLRLIKFSGLQDSGSGAITIVSQSAKRKGGDDTATVVRYEEWFDVVVKGFEASPDGIIPLEDLCKAAGVSGFRVPRRGFNRCLRRVIKAGMLVTLRARIDSAGRMQASSATDDVKDEESKERWLRCVKITRTPTLGDRQAFEASLKRNAEYDRAKPALRNDDLEDSDENDDEQDETVQIDSAAQITNLVISEYEKTLLGMHTSFLPDLHYANSVFDIIDAAGPKGISSMEVCELTGSSFWRRPHEEMMPRLSDQWHISQPPHLRHLSIIRDTRIRGTVSHYIFRTFANHRKAVEAGEALWDYVLPDKPSIRRVLAQPDLDRWGFPVLPAAFFHGKSRESPVIRCVKSLPAAVLTKQYYMAPENGVGTIKAASPEADEDQLGNGALIASAESMSDVLRQQSSTPRATEDAESAQDTSARLDSQTPQRKRGRPRQEGILNTTAKAMAEKRDKWTERFDDLTAAFEARARTLARSRLVATTTAEFAAEVAVAAPPTKRNRGRPRKDAGTSRADQSGNPPAMPVDLETTSNGDAGGPTTAADQPIDSANASVGHKKRKRQSAPSFDVQDEEIAQLARTITSLSQPGAYVDEPRAVLVRRDTAAAAGRPRNARIVTIKSSRLASFAWFEQDPTALPSARLLYFVPALAQDPHVVEHIPEAATMTEHLSQDRPRSSIRKGRGPVNQDDSTASNDFEMPDADEVDVKPTRRQLGGKHPPSSALKKKVIDVNEPDTAPLATDATATTETEVAPDVNSRVPASDAQASLDKVSTPTGPETAPTTAVAPDAVINIPDDVTMANDLPTEDRAQTIQHIDGATKDLLQKSADSASEEIDRKPDIATASPAKPVGAVKADLLAPAARRIPGLGMFDMVNQNTEPTKKPPRPYRPTPKRNGVLRSEGLATHQRLRIALDIVRQCGGVFPGSRELYYSFGSVWYSKYSQHPDVKTVSKCIKSLITADKLKRVAFPIKTGGNVKTRHLLLESHVDPRGTAVEEMKRNIQDAYPSLFFPKQAPLALRYRRLFVARQHTSWATMSGPKGFTRDETAFVPYPEEISTPIKDVQSERKKRKRRDTEAEAGENDEPEDYLAAMLDPEALRLVSQFQLDMYNFQPEASYIDRGESGRKHLSHLVRLGKEDKQQRRPKSLGTIQSFKEKKAKKQPRDVFVNQMIDPSHDRDVALFMADPLVVFQPTSGTFATFASRPINTRQHYWVDGHAQKKFQLSDTNMRYETADTVALPRHNAQRTLEEIAPKRRRWELPEPAHPFDFENEFVDEDYRAVPIEEGIRFSGEGEAPSRESTKTSRKPVVESESESEDENEDEAEVEVEDDMPSPAASAIAMAMESYDMDPALRGRRDRDRVGAHDQSVVRRRYMPTNPTTQGASRRLKRTQIGSAFKALDPRDNVPMSPSEETRLLYAIAVVKTLAGGLQQDRGSVNYLLVNQAMHFKFDARYCREHWAHVKYKHEAFVDQLQQRFRQLFLDAYSRKRLPEINMAEPEKIKWASLVDWAQSRLAVDPSHPDTLPTSREALDEVFVVEASENTYTVEQEEFFGPNTSTVRRDEMINLLPYFDRLDVKAQESETEDPSQDMVAQSWIRANVLTPQAVYDEEEAQKKLTSYNTAAMRKALDSMLGQKLIKGVTKSRNMPGRQYVIAESLATTLALPWQWDLGLFQAAAQFKQAMDDSFRRTGALEMPVDTADNGAALAVLNLVSHGRIALAVTLPPIDNGFDTAFPKLTKWGMTDGDYKSMQLARSKFAFALVARPTPSYAHTPATPAPVPPVPLQVPSTPGDAGPRRLPFWTDVHGALVPAHLRDLALAALYALAARPGASAAKLARTLKGKVWAWELQVLCGWLGAAGLLEADGDGWVLAEGFWDVARVLAAVGCGAADVVDGAEVKRGAKRREYIPAAALVAAAAAAAAGGSWGGSDEGKEEGDE